MIDTIIIVIILSIPIALYFKRYRAIDIEYNLLAERYKKLLSQKKHSEITTGQIAEKLVPFLKHFKHNPKDALFCGNPIDYIIFGEKHITFIEVKTGKARLTKKQRKIKELVKQKNVEWEEIRIN
tara:strand:- start:1728 stop:2102 length:375 start_codon:yes stop_codon:yes gene_type:complete